MHFKDTILNDLADKANVAQFVSYDPTLTQRYSRIYGYETNDKFTSINEAISAVLNQSVENSVNIRSFDPKDPKSREFFYGLKDINQIEESLQRLSSEGLYTIVNETIDINDGGVSGVILGDVIEFAPGDTPRCVEKPGTASLPREIGLNLLKIVYGFLPALDYSPQTRVEFSIHPLRRGFLHDHTIIWELEDIGISHANANINWPNRFSQFIGDKTYGLLIAYLLNLPVPYTTVISRKIAPFSFGQSTGCTETWIRTSPMVQMPGKFTTKRGWCDPFELMKTEDPDDNAIASILSQIGIEAAYSGALIVGKNEEIIIEGIQGYGEDFMIGQKHSMELPDDILNSVKNIYKQVVEQLGAVRMEWVADSQKIWVVQLHQGSTKSYGNTIYPGSVSYYYKFDVKQGLEELRHLISTINPHSEGIILMGDVGITSHFGDVLRRAKIPSKIEAVEKIFNNENDDI
ncbi:hypothetical protein [Aphanothece sacrum]|uniref:Uncharacterized protein n=1 Tax=Aphanothece sacrum FPU1 TaxID=1920663 RepID=A0A401IN73_APHSA|nr:hypothetical protein [Aphanothece sacrum]GBF82699.1 hypothetical protein AsFPU1_4133 [Aphanothece sacrum FPU1]GBF84509.1 hypothetical protein AsFPU3_1558 [Aphanothece sacrum FPU3]